MKKKALGDLSTNLMKPTCANIRNEFRLLFNAGCDNSDKGIIKEFFLMPFGTEISDLAVKRCDTDKFKALCNFLQKGIKTHERNLELLAWLIDFNPRPFSKFCRLSNGKTNVLSELSITENGIVEENKLEVLNHRQPSSLAQETNYVKSGFLPKQDYWPEKHNDLIGHPISTDRFIRKEVTLVYPSGVKVSVDASDISLIAELVRL